MTEENREFIDNIVSHLLDGSIEKSHIIQSSLRRIATWNVPNIDYAFQDFDSGKTIAVFFCDDYSEAEVKLICIKALNTFDSCVACFDVLQLADANKFVQTLFEEDLYKLPIGVIAKDSNGSIAILQALTIQENIALSRTVKEQKSYWCWWRDASHYEVATLLGLSLKYDEQGGDIYTKFVYPEFFDMMISGKTKKWDGNPRIKRFSEASYKSEKQNYKIPMCQLGFWDAETGHITSKGKHLLDIVNHYGEDSEEYFYCLAKIILVDGKHLDLVKDLDEFQKNNPEIIPETSAEFFVLFDEYMISKNSIGTRKPSAVKTGAKNAYVRDEPKLWNKLGIIRMQGASRYYRPYKGIEFDWERVNKIILFNAFGGNCEEI